MRQPQKWLINNKEWVFSGIGVVALTFVAGFFIPETPNAEQSTQSAEAGSDSTIIQAPNSSGNITINTPISEDYPKEVHPVINLARPVEEQVQLFAADTVRIQADPEHLKEVWVGGIWEPYEPGREYIAWGVPGQPITPKFRGDGLFKMTIETSIQRTQDLDKPRDIRSQN